MLSGRGIDSELRSKFGEWSEKFWKSSSWGNLSGTKNFRAIYFANGGRIGGEGEKLEDLNDNGEKILIKEYNDKVQSIFSFCVGNQNGNGCKKNDNKASVVLVGDDPNVNALNAWEGLKDGEWGDQTSLVRSGHSYDGLFAEKFWTGRYHGSGSKIRGLVLQGFLQRHSHSGLMAQILCPWSQVMGRDQYRALQARCKGKWGTELEAGKGSLFDFLNDESASKYFNPSRWADYGEGWKGVAFLVLMKLWSADLAHVNYGGSRDIFERKAESFSLGSLIKPGKDVIFASLDSEGGKITYIDKYSSNKWAVLLKGGSGEHESSQSLSVTLSEGELCIRKLICLRESDLNRQKSKITSSLRTIDQNYFGRLWSLIFGKTGGRWDYKIAFMALVAACFKDVEKVSFTVQESSKEGKVIFTQLNNKK